MSFGLSRFDPIIYSYVVLFRLIYVHISDIIVILCLDAREFGCKRTWKNVHGQDVDDGEREMMFI
jgi:hypothetical protein